MSNIITSIVRTLASKVVGGLLGVAAALGVAVPAELSEQATVALSGAMFVAIQFVYYVAARWAERRWPVLGRLLLWSGRQPVYQAPRTAAAVEADAARFRQ